MNRIVIDAENRIVAVNRIVAMNRIVACERDSRHEHCMAGVNMQN